MKGSLAAWAALGIAVVMAGLTLTALGFGVRLGAAQERDRQETAQKAMKAGQDAALAAAASAIAKIEVKSAPIQELLVREIRTAPVYRDCAHTPDGLRHLNELITGEGSDPGSGGMPKANPVERPGVRGDD